MSALPPILDRGFLTQKHIKMDYKELLNQLKDYNQNEVKVFLGYVKDLETDKDRNGVKRNKWFPHLTASKAANMYRKVALDNLYIDGDTIILTNKGKIMVSYNYQAYKNRLLNIYPETKFDIQNVFEGDTFSFRKESGVVIYTHEIKNPFELNKTIIGCYCIIKNNRGEFIETLNRDEIKKIRNVAKTQNIWNNWEGEMILKSVIKRACKRHFKDIVVNIESIDNDNYDVETVNVDHTIKELIDKCQTSDDLQKVYTDNKGKIKDEPTFLRLLTEKKEEIIENEGV